MTGPRWAQIAVVLALGTLATPLRAVVSSASAQGAGRAVVVVLEGKIDDFERDALIRRFKEARSRGATTVILEIDTKGGLVSSALDISRFIKQQTDLRTIAFIADEAYSAGALIAMACDEIVMRPAAAIGDCAPIVFRSDGSLETLGAAERAKAESPVLADFRDSARRNGYDPLLAEAMVVVDRAVHLVENASGLRRFVDGATYKQLISSSDAIWKPVAGVSDPIDGAGSLLTVHSEEALKIGLSKGEFADANALARARELSVIARLEPGAGDAFVEVLASPIARMLMIIVFAVSLKLSISTPGHGIPEALAVMTIGLLAGVPLLTGHASWWEIALIFGGLALVAFEVFVFPGHFVSAVLGVLMIIAGLVLTFVGREPPAPGVLPNMAMTWAAIQRGLLVVVGGLICSMLLWIWLNRYLPHMPYFNRILLSPRGAVAGSPGEIETGWPTIGATGRAVTDLKPGGAVEFFDEAMNENRTVSVVSDSGFVPVGADVRVTESRGSYLVVCPVKA
jgi:membrane-bound serine protease (ClpP class)